MALEIKRKKTKTVTIGTVMIGGNHPIAIQSMAKVPTKNVKAVVRQIHSLEQAGCDIIRVAVLDRDDAKAIRRIKERIRIPLVADIHFHYELALMAIDGGVDKIRLNPGNITKTEQIKAVVAAAKRRMIPIRIGVNSGSVRDVYLKKGPALGLVAQAHDYIKMFEDFHFTDIVVSLKSSNILETIEAYRKMSATCRYPLHVGVTATGLFNDAIVKSCLGTGILLFEGIGDTIRVSLLDDPLQEVAVAQSIISALGIRTFGPEYICCPTCGRCQVDLKEKARRLSEKIATEFGKGALPLTIALMGCVVNGPGEAKHADIGIAFGKSKGILFKKGKIVATIPQNRSVDVLVKKIKEMRHD